MSGAFVVRWAMRDSNPRPLPCEGSALTNCANRPCGVVVPTGTRSNTTGSREPCDIGADAGGVAPGGHARTADPVWLRPRCGLMYFKCPGRKRRTRNADVAQLVAHHLAKVRVASSSLVIRSTAAVRSVARRAGSTPTRRPGRGAGPRTAKPRTPDG